MIKKAFGGILLVDEAYYLYNAANDKDYGQESIEILLNVMEEQKDDLIVTLAGCAQLVFLCSEVFIVNLVMSDLPQLDAIAEVGDETGDRCPWVIEEGCARSML